VWTLPATTGAPYRRILYRYTSDPKKAQGPAACPPIPIRTAPARRPHRTAASASSLGDIAQSQRAGQVNSTAQQANGGTAVSAQLAPVNANVPVRLLSSGNDTNNQSNTSTAHASASNTNITGQGIQQYQQAG